MRQNLRLELEDTIFANYNESLPGKSSKRKA